jgi:hypothetical protein
MLRQIMVVIITRMGRAQTYNQGVRNGFIMTGINKLYSNNSSSSSSSNNNNSKTTTTTSWYATHERDEGL